MHQNTALNKYFLLIGWYWNTGRKIVLKSFTIVSPGNLKKPWQQKWLLHHFTVQVLYLILAPLNLSLSFMHSSNTSTHFWRIQYLKKIKFNFCSTVYKIRVHSVPITNKVVRSNPIHGEVHSLQHYWIKFVSDLWQVSSFLWETLISSINKTDRHDITEILSKVALNTINKPT